MSSNKRNASRKNEKPIEIPDDELEVVVNFDKSKGGVLMPRLWQKAYYEFSLDWQRHTTKILSKLPRTHVGAHPASI